MKIDLDLIRMMLLGAEQYNGDISICNPGVFYHSCFDNLIDNESITKNQAYYYIAYLKDANFLEDLSASHSWVGELRKKSNGSFDCKFTRQYNVTIWGGAKHQLPYVRLTYQGHEFLDSIRHKDIFDKIKETAKENGGSFTLELVKELGMSYLKKKIGL